MIDEEIENSNLSHQDKKLLGLIDSDLKFLNQKKNEGSIVVLPSKISLDLRLMKLKYLNSTNEKDLISRYIFRASTIKIS